MHALPAVSGSIIVGRKVMGNVPERLVQGTQRRLCVATRAPAGLAALLLLSALAPGAANAATATTTMPVTMTITAGCTVAATSVAFGSQSVLASNTAASGTLSVTCTNTTPYNVGLDAGGGAGATVSVRKMTGPASAIINYGLFQNAALTTVFGNTVGTNTVAGTGNGTSQTITVFGQVPAQSSPAPGSYADVVNVTITF